jgi:hypothetical protein
MVAVTVKLMNDTGSGNPTTIGVKFRSELKPGRPPDEKVTSISLLDVWHEVAWPEAPPAPGPSGFCPVVFQPLVALVAGSYQ